MNNDYKQSKEINLEHLGCAICEDSVEYCFECDKQLEGIFYCDGFGEHVCKKCFNKKIKEKT